MITAQSTIVTSLDRSVQLRLLEQAREVCRQSPLVRPRTPNGMPMRVRVTAAGDLGWVGDGAYRYSATDSRGRPWPKMPLEWRHIAELAAGVYPWDSAILNFFDGDASLGWHRDKSERDQSLPIVTISLGDAASWAIRADESSQITRCKLSSGDVTLLYGEVRNYLHTIERVIAEPLLSPMKARGRVSITLRVAG